MYVCVSVAQRLGRWTCDQRVARVDLPPPSLRAATRGKSFTRMRLCRRQYNLVPAKGRWCCGAGKATVSLALHWPCATDNSGIAYSSYPTGSKPGKGKIAE